MNADCKYRYLSWPASFFLILGALAATPADAQTDSGGIEGVVRDTSGAVLPGVTIVISSP